MKKLILLVAMFLGLYAAPAHAACSINTVPQIGVVCDFARNPTDSATATGLVPAASATDLFCISGSATKTIAIREISIAGVAGTAVSTPFLIYQRSALDTGGTAATGLALPVPVPYNATDPAATAVLTAYTANPTVASSPLLMDASMVSLPVSTGSAASTRTLYGTSVDNFNKGLDIPKNTTLQYCVNLNGVSVSSGVVTIHMEWTEN